MGIEFRPHVAFDDERFIAFDPSICRNIGVDIRYVLFVIDRIGGAGYLLDEMKFSRKK